MSDGKKKTQAEIKHEEPKQAEITPETAHFFYERLQDQRAAWEAALQCDAGVVGVQRMTITRVILAKGEGTNNDVCRHVTSYWTDDGRLLAEDDPAPYRPPMPAPMPGEGGEGEA